MKVRALLVAGVAMVAAAAPALVTVDSAHAAPAHVHAAKHHGCTRTSSGKCIKGGEFCPKADYGHSGWDAKGRRYVCKGSHSHPHWEKP